MPAPGVLVSDQADVSSAIGAIVREGTLAQAAVEVISDVAQQMLQSEGFDLMARALRRIFDVVPSAQRVTVVQWPIDPEQGLLSLLPEAVLRREGLPDSPVSTTMATYAAESRKAVFFFHGSSEHAAVSNAPSVLANRIQTAIYVPLIGVEQKICAVLCVDTPEPSLPLTRDDFHFIRAIGSLLSAALHADQLREQTRHRELQAREIEAQRRAMSDSLQVAAHDLKNPLTVILLAAQTAQKNRDAALRDDLLEQIGLAAKRARALVETYLEAAAQAASESAGPAPVFVTSQAAVDPRQVVDEEIAFLASTPDRPTNIVNQVQCRSLPADLNKLRQIFGNLLSNALKYSPAGSEVRVESRQQGDRVYFSVIDRGIGIAEEERNRIGEPFHRLGDTGAREGTGLGLWITRGLVESHGGGLRVEATPGGGSTFVFWLPVENAR